MSEELTKARQQAKQQLGNTASEAVESLVRAVIRDERLKLQVPKAAEKTNGK